MATIIDKLFVTFGLDPSEFVTGQKVVDDSQKKNRDTSLKTRKQMEDDGKRTVEAFRKIRNEVLALVASFVGLSAIKQFTSEITHSDASLWRMAKTLGMSVPDLWVWQKAMANFGVTAQETDAALSSLTDLAQSWKFGAPIAADLSRKLTQAGVDVVKFHDSTTTLDERLLMLAEAFHKVGPAATEALAGPLGLGRQFVAELAINGPAGIEKMRAAMRALGPVSEAQAAAAQKREQEWNAMQTRIQNFQRYLVERFWPIVEPIILRMMNWWDRNQVEIVGGMTSAITFLGTELKKIPWDAIGKDIEGIARHANEAAQAFGGWGKTLEAISLLWAGGKITTSILGLTALLRMAGVVGGGAAVGAGGAAVAGGVGSTGAAILGLLGILSPFLLALYHQGTDVIDEHGMGEDARMDALRKKQGVKGYGANSIEPNGLNPGVYGPPSSSMTKTSVNSASQYTINLYASSSEPGVIVRALDTYFRNLAIAAPAQQGGR